MHSLHLVLVYLPDHKIDHKMKNSDKIRKVRRAAEEYTEFAYERVFDWRETDTAGRWEDEYPVNIRFASDGVDEFINELNRIVNVQDVQIDRYLKYIKENGTNDLDDLVYMIKHGGEFMLGWYLEQIAEMANGTYTFESQFYDTHNWTAKVSENLFEDIKSDPDNWALAYFDYHI